jgi:hypothetical protein
VLRGDLSNRLPPRWLFVFEGVIGQVPPPRVAEYKLATRLHRWRRAVDCFELEDHVRKVIWDLTWRRDYRFDVVTFLGQSFAEHLERRLDRESLPFSNVWAVDEQTLAQRLTFMPDVQYVIHGDPARHLSYGPRGLLVTDPRRLTL